VQIAAALRQGVRSGRLGAGSSVPSTRALASDLGVSRGVIVEAYAQLVAEGYLESRPGARTVVARGARPTVGERRATPRVARPRFDFRPGVPDLARFPREEWSRAARRVFRRMRPHHLGYSDPAGALELRAALAEYLGRVRGAACDPRRIVVCSGFAQALRVAAGSLRRSGARLIAVEDPGQSAQIGILAAAGLTAVPVPVDERGLRIDALEQCPAEAVVVTPAHQFPTGSVLPPDRRRELLAWAHRRSAYVIEDDYDAEYRYDRCAPGALQGLAPDRVIYAGSASKILAPALRVGWMMLPEPLLEGAEEEKRLADLGSAFVEQLVYAELLGVGALDRHLRRMRGVYRERRDELLDSLSRHLPRWTPHGAAAGLHLTAFLPEGLTERTVITLAERRSIRLYGLGDFRLSRRSAAPGGVVLGYAALTPREIRRAISELAAGGAAG
jgi:GntR family transcriptional regulator/MocR family aminotransferase